MSDLRFRSQVTHGVAELEFACPHNATSVLVARMVVLGCTSALAVALMVAATAASLKAGAFDVALWAVPPYFLSCAGCLMTQRKASPSTAAALCTVWTLACCGALAVLANALPNMYALASLYAAMIVVLVPLAMRAFRRHQVA